MTVYSTVKQTLASLEGAKATMVMYSQISQNPEARHTFQRNAQRLEKVLEQLKKEYKPWSSKNLNTKGFKGHLGSGFISVLRTGQVNNSVAFIQA